MHYRHTHWYRVKYRGGLGTVCSHAAAQHCMVWLYAYLWH